MAVARATIRTDTWTTMYNHLQTGTYAISTNNIFSAWNSTLLSDKGYPTVIIYPPGISYEDFTLNGLKMAMEITYGFEVFHNNAASLKSMCDEICNKIITGRNVFRAVNLYKLKISETDYDSWEEGGKKIHRASFQVSFNYKE